LKRSSNIEFFEQRSIFWWNPSFSRIFSIWKSWNAFDFTIRRDSEETWRWPFAFFLVTSNCFDFPKTYLELYFDYSAAVNIEVSFSLFCILYRAPLHSQNRCLTWVFLIFLEIV
jgi:hypothetical protein